MDGKKVKGPKTYEDRVYESYKGYLGNASDELDTFLETDPTDQQIYKLAYAVFHSDHDLGREIGRFFYGGIENLLDLKGISIDEEMNRLSILIEEPMKGRMFQSIKPQVVNNLQSIKEKLMKYLLDTIPSLKAEMLSTMPEIKFMDDFIALFNIEA